MSRDWLRYDLLVQEALRGVVRSVLQRVARENLPGNHHFFISFRTNYPGVAISDALRARYPDEMTIVLQNQYRDLQVDETGFSVGLSFQKMLETLRIPFAALTLFHDPSVQFQLPFQPGMIGPRAGPKGEARPAEAIAQRAAEPAKETGEASPEKARAPAGADGGSVVSLDSFRKK